MPRSVKALPLTDSVETNSTSEAVGLIKVRTTCESLVVAGVAMPVACVTAPPFHVCVRCLGFRFQGFHARPVRREQDFTPYSVILSTQ